MRRERIGLALGGGAARGWAHLGVLAALEEAGIAPDVVCGTSVGALVGGAWAAGRLPALTGWALAADRRAVAGMIDLGLTNGGLVAGGRIVDWLRGLGIRGPIEAMARPFAAVATDLVSGHEVWLRRGDLAGAIRASIAMPGIFCPVQVERRWLVDGGLVNPVPISVCRALGADRVIAVNLGHDLVGRRFAGLEQEAPPERKGEGLLDLLRPLPGGEGNPLLGLMGGGRPAPRYVEVLANSLNIMQDRITRSRLAGDPPDVQIAPQVAAVGLLDFHRAREIAEEGRRATLEALPALRARLTPLPRPAIAAIL